MELIEIFSLSYLINKYQLIRKKLIKYVKCILINKYLKSDKFFYFYHYYFFNSKESKDKIIKIK